MITATFSCSNEERVLMKSARDDEAPLLGLAFKLEVELFLLPVILNLETSF